MTDRDQMFGHSRPAREPFFLAPRLTLLLPGLMILLYVAQWLAPVDVKRQIIDALALSPLLLRSGYYELLVTHIFLHGSWLHVLANSIFCLTFSTPLVRAMGRGLGGAISFVAFFLLCGIAGGLGYCLANWHSATPVVGASGAISGAIGAAVRLPVYDEDPHIKPLWHLRVLVMTVAWIIINGLTGLASVPVGDGMMVAWQTHIAGYLFGLILISPWMHVFHRRYFQS